MSDNVAVLHPDVEFIRPCNLCPHMKRITLKNIRHALETGRHEVTIDPAIAGAGPARRRKDAGAYEHGDFSAQQPSRHHRRRRGRIDDGAADGAGAGVAAVEGAARCGSVQPVGAGRTCRGDGRGRRPCPASGRYAGRRRGPLRRSRRAPRSSTRRLRRSKHLARLGVAFDQPAGRRLAARPGSARTAATGSCTRPATAPGARSCAP